MRSTRSTVRNFLSVAAASVVTKLLNLFVVAFLARKLQAEAYGQYNFAMAVANYVLLAFGLGLESYAVREVARRSAEVAERVNSVLTLRCVTLLLASGLMLVVVVVLPKPVLIKQLVLLSFVAGAIGLLRLSWVFTGLERLHWTAAATVVEQGLNAALIFLFVRHPADVKEVPVYLCVANFVSGGLLMALYVREWGWPSWRLAWSDWKITLRESLPMGLSTILVTVYKSFDTVLISFLRTDQEVGWYSAAYRLILAIVTLRVMIVTVVYPPAARLFVESRERFATFIRDLLRMSVGVCLPMAVGITLLAPEIVRVMFGAAYASTIAPLQILGWSAALYITNATFAILLYAAGHQADETRAVAAGMITSLALNILLIPRYGIIGAAATAAAADVVVIGWLYYCSRRMIAVELAATLLRPLIGCVTMAAILFLLRERSLLLTIPLGAGIYGVTLFVVGGIGERERSLLRTIWPRRNTNP